MFSLIIIVISIALGAAMALATLYFGGDAFNEGSAKATAATLVNQAQQINGANTLHFLDEQVYGDMAALTAAGKYLQAAPNPGQVAAESDLDGVVTVAKYDVATADGKISLDIKSEAVCKAVNQQSGLGGVLAADEAGLADVQFGCYGAAGAESFTFVFK